MLLIDTIQSLSLKDKRAYTMLEELDAQPSVYYMAKVRNNETAGYEEAHHEAAPAHHEG
jgi:hypothetical protein